MILIPTRSISRNEVAQAFESLGFTISFRIPFTGSAQSSDWERGEDRVAYSSDLASGLAFFVVASSEPERIAAQVQSFVPCETVDQLIQRDLAATEPAAQARAALRFLELGRFLRVEPTLKQSELAQGLSKWMRSDHHAVRMAAAESVFTHDWPELDEAVESMTQRDPSLAWIAASWKKTRDASEKRARDASDKQAREALAEALESLVTAKRWDEALSAAEKVLASNPKAKVPPIRARALALEGLGRLAEAWVWAAVWTTLRETNESAETLDRIEERLPKSLPSLTREIILAWKTLDDDEPMSTMLATLRERTTDDQRRRDLAFFECAVRVEKSYVNAQQKASRPALEEQVRKHPSHVDGWMLLATARRADGDIEGADQAYVEARKHVGGAPSEHEAELSSFVRALDRDPPTELSILSAHRWMYESEKDNAGLIRICDAMLALELPPEERATTLRKRAIAATFSNRHDEAIRDYRAAINAGDADENGLLRFNLACELAKAGQKDEALTHLKEAIARSNEWRSKARSDDYFSALWQDRDFILVTSGLEQAPSAEDVERWISRSLGWSMRGEGDESIQEANLAVAGAMLLEDNKLLARALSQLGAAQTYAASPKLAEKTLERAATLARESLRDEPVQLARVLHHQAAALHASNRWEDAHRVYSEVLSIREAALGKLSFEVAITLGDLARLSSDREQVDEAIELQSQTTDVLLAVLETKEGDDRLDILLNLALNEGNRAAAALQKGLPEDVIVGHAEAMTGFLEKLVEGQGNYPPHTLTRIRRVLSSALERNKSDEIAERAMAVGSRLLVLETPDPRERAERIYWAMLRGGIRDLIAKGVAETAIAASIAKAIRGHDPGEPVASHPAFANLAAELAKRLTGKADIVMVAMSVDLAVSGAQPVEEAIGGLEAFALANLTD
ncbi:MAG: tetratricopeptide repeat protein [Polyangiaceae bacterium]